MAENYIPNREDVLRAEAMMSDEQKEGSKERVKEVIVRLEAAALELRRVIETCRIVETTINEQLIPDPKDRPAPIELPHENQLRDVELAIDHLQKWISNIQ